MARGRMAPFSARARRSSRRGRQEWRVRQTWPASFARRAAGSPAARTVRIVHEPLT